MMTLIYNKAVQYAEDIVDGKIPSNPYVYKVCKSFLDDLHNDRYVMDMEVLSKIEKKLSKLRFATGEEGIASARVVDHLHPYQAFLLANVYGWRHSEDRTKLRYNDIIFFVSRKNAKTWICALIVYLNITAFPQFSEMYSLSSQKELALEVYKALRQLIEASELTHEFHITRDTILYKKRKSFYKALPYNIGNTQGKRPSVIVYDELGGMSGPKDNELVEGLQSGMLSVGKNTMKLFISTGYAVTDNIMEKQVDYAKRVIDKVVEDEKTFALLYYTEDDMSLTDEGLKQSNPLVQDLEQSWEKLQHDRAKAIDIGGEKLVEFRTKHENAFLETQSAEGFITLDEIQRCRIDDFDWNGKEVYVGIDLASSDDNTAVSMVCYHEGKYVAKSWAFIPSNKVYEKSRREKVNYTTMQQNGYCFHCGDDVISFSYVENFILNLEKEYGVTVMGICYDPWGAKATVERLDNEGHVVIGIKQHSSILPTAWFKEKILTQEFNYERNRLLEINFLNCRQTVDTNLRPYLNKKRSSGKIDMVFSILNAMTGFYNDELNRTPMLRDFR